MAAKGSVWWGLRGQEWGERQTGAQHPGWRMQVGFGCATGGIWRVVLAGLFAGRSGHGKGSPRSVLPKEMLSNAAIRCSLLCTHPLGTRIPVRANGIRAWRMCRGAPGYQPRGPRPSGKPTKAGGRRKRRRRKSRTWSSSGDSGSSVGTRPGAQLSTSGRFTFRSLPLGFSPTVLFRSWELPFNSSRKQLRNPCFF